MLQSRHPTRPIRVALCIADRARRADIADACQNAEIAVADPDEPIEDVDVVVADRRGRSGRLGAAKEQRECGVILPPRLGSERNVFEHLFFAGNPGHAFWHADAKFSSPSAR